MPPSPLYNDPGHWRARAAEILTIADQMSDSRVRAIMHDIAADYRRLAERAEIRTAVDPRDNSARDD